MNSTVKYSLMIIIAILMVAASICMTYYHVIIQKVKSDDPLVWESDIRKFEQADKKSAQKTEGILFVGSSSIRFWNSLAEDMHPLPVQNRGFGGAKIPDLIHYASRIILPHRPKILVFYCGDNDMSMGRKQSPKEVAGNYQRFVDLIHSELPETRIFFVSIKPSLARWEDWPNMARANQMIRQFSEQHKQLEFIDASSSMLGADGLPRKDLLIFDGVHMNDKGYDAWTAIIKPLLEAEYSLAYAENTERIPPLFDLGVDPTQQ